MLAEPRLAPAVRLQPADPEDYRAYLASLGERKLGYLARRRDDGAIVGWINVSEIVRGGFQSAFLGYCGTPATRARAT